VPSEPPIERRNFIDSRDADLTDVHRILDSQVEHGQGHAEAQADRIMSTTVE
jgi:hypothetical protein